MKTFTCKVAQKGFYAGPVFCTRVAAAKDKKTGHPERELERLRGAVVSLRKEIERQHLSGSNEEIQETVLSILSDEIFADRIEKKIKEDSYTAETAVYKAGQELAEELEKFDSEYIRSRQDDIQGVARQLIYVLKGKDHGPEETCAICAAEISPSQISSIPEDKIGGLLTEKGSPNSHASIMAGNMGIPYLYGNAEAVAAAEKARFIILDSDSAVVITDPEESVRREAEARMAAVRNRSRKAAQEKGADSIKCRTGIYANIKGPEDIEALLDSKADGVGLFRTEFLFLGTDTIPTEDEQLEAYQKVLAAMGEKEVIIRTMDIGSDKRVPWLDLPEESNPALGLRGVRVSLERKDLFRTQLRALLRAGTVGNLKVMFPMISGTWEIDEIKEFIEQTATELEAEGVPYRIPPLGIMVETPSAAVCADKLAEKVDFFSIGTNDLTQYTLALDREARGLDRYYRPHDDAIFRLIKMTADGGHKYNVPTGVCGQLAADRDAVLRLIEAGVDELSVPVSKVKATRALAVEAEKLLSQKNMQKVAAAADGELIPQSEIPDPVFAGGTMGECFGILPENGCIYAPADGTVLSIAQTGHAITISADDGRQILIHVGINTASLEGRAFRLHVKTGDRVKADQLLMEADLHMIQAAGLSPIVVVALL